VPENDKLNLELIIEKKNQISIPITLLK